MTQNTYYDDLRLLSGRIKTVEIGDSEGARVLVAPAFQGRVMTSTLGGPDAEGFGWVNRQFISSGADDDVFNNYGGEDRFWLGPEAGQFGLWFKKDDPFDLPHWKTPAGLNRGKFRLTSQSKTAVAMTADFKVQSYSGTTFTCAVRRVVRLLSRGRVAEMLGSPIPAGVKSVAFESANTLVNAGEQAWTPSTGLLSVWVLGQFKPLERGRIIVPFNRGCESELGPKATTGYFGDLPPQRCKIGEDYLLFSCDGEFRSKIGISPSRSKNVLGSYDPDKRSLTIVQFNLPGGASRLPYVNSLWRLQDQPFAGDVVNAYNDGKAQGSQKPPGRFYELETSSPAAELSPGQDVTHVHRTMHFQGAADGLSQIALRVLGADLAQI